MGATTTDQLMEAVTETKRLNTDVQALLDGMGDYDQGFADHQTAVEQQIEGIQATVNNIDIRGTFPKIDPAVDYATKTAFDELHGEFDQEVADRNILGDKTFQGHRHAAVFQGWLHGSGVDENGVGWPAFGNGDFQHPEAVLDAGQGTNLFLHLKTPLSLDEHNEMFLFEFYGQQFGGAKFVKETMAGYCYKNADALTHVQAEGNNEPAVYVGSDRRIYLRISLLSSYYLTLGVDAIRVGNGRMFQ